MNKELLRRKRISETMKRRRLLDLPPWNKGLTLKTDSRISKLRPWLGKKNPNHSQRMKGKSPWNKGKPHYAIRGSNNHRWKGGITPEMEKIRHSLKYKLWRKSVFERDNFTCQFCGKHGGYLHADHIKPFSLFPSLRFKLSNGRTLCVPCHISTDTYKLGINKFNKERADNPELL